MKTMNLKLTPRTLSARFAPSVAPRLAGMLGALLLSACALS